MSDGSGLKNRGKRREDADERRSAVSEFCGVELSSVDDYTFDAEIASKNIENMIGVTQVPLGFAGPVDISGDFAEGSFLVPMATTEGALVASVSRGMAATRAAGGITTSVFSEGMTRAPVLRTEGIEHSHSVVQWIQDNMSVIESAVAETTSHGRLLSIEPYPCGRNLYLRFTYFTGDAMGMNMATIATERVCSLIEEATGAVTVSVSGNMCTDKKPAAINAILGRGRCVLAEARIPAETVEKMLHADVSRIVEVNYRKNLLGSAMAGSMGFNAHAANMVAALYIATGQDPAQVVEGSLCTTTCEDYDGDLYISVRMPAVEVGTVGGGTRLPTQSEALKMMDCLGEGKADKFAEIVAATVLAGELSTIAAQAAGQLGKAHKQLGR